MRRGGRDPRRLRGGGRRIFSFFGITVPAFQIAGGLLFTLVSFREVQEGESRVRPSDAEKEDPSIVPLGIPVISGPGAISAVMVWSGRLRTVRDGSRSALRSR